MADAVTQFRLYLRLEDTWRTQTHSREGEARRGQDSSSSSSSCLLVRVLWMYLGSCSSSGVDHGDFVGSASVVEALVVYPKRLREN